MKYSEAYFDQVHDRRGSGSTKWDGCSDKFGVAPSQEIIPMWIADMDFKSPQEVQDAIVERARFGSYGYTMKTDSFYRAIIDWVARRYHWAVKKEWIVVSPGVIPGLHVAIQSLTEPGDGIIVQTPVYYPFMTGVTINGRALVNNRLAERDGDWVIDFEDLERKVKDPANKMMIFCSPHNPVGRAWSRDELVRLAHLCAENNVLLIADEIHADLTMKGCEHHAVCAVADEWKDHTITYYAPSKTFNLAGLQTAYAIIPDQAVRERYIHGLEINRIFNLNWFSAAALETAYTQCDDYVEALRGYIGGNVDYMVNFLEKRLPFLKMKKPQATYMTWVDFRGTGMTTDEIERFIVEKAHIGVDLGSWFGPGGEGYLRFNLGCPMAQLAMALNQLETAFSRFAPPERR